MISDPEEVRPRKSRTEPTDFEKARKFKAKVLSLFRSANKTSWRKNEVIDRVKDLWTEFLEEEYIR